LNGLIGECRMELKIMRKGINYSLNGTGNRLVFFLQGCDMLCPWCSNPEGLAPGGTLLVHQTNLTDDVCPQGRIIEGKLDRTDCTDCSGRECVDSQKNAGLSFSCTTVDVKDLIAEAQESRSLFFDGGGVTISGGEPTLQFEALKELLEGLRAAGIHTAIETNALNPRLPELFELINLLIIDFKHDDDAIHTEMTGVSNKTIEANIKAALAWHPNVLIRTPLIASFNADPKIIHRFVAFFHECGAGNARFELLKYHEYGRQKWDSCGLEYTMNKGYISDSLFRSLENIYKKAGLNVIRS